MSEFGQKGKHGLYIPMSEDESETILKLWENREYRLYDKNLGELEIKNLLVGDKRVGIQFQVGPKCFEQWEVARPFSIFDLELWARGRLLIRKEISTLYDGKPLMVHRGFFSILQLDIAIDHIRPDFVKEINNTKGLTNRKGNEKFNSKQRWLANQIQAGSEKVARFQKENLNRAKNQMSKYPHE